MSHNPRKRSADGQQRANNVTKKRRCDDELKRFAAQAFQNLGVKRLPRPTARAAPRLTDWELVQALRKSAPKSRNNQGWDCSFARHLAGLARQCDGR